jgi:peptidoglycan/xylan/chitin deacetylase (PgdA/CDA1 family)
MAHINFLLKTQATITKLTQVFLTAGVLSLLIGSISVAYAVSAPRAGESQKAPPKDLQKIPVQIPILVYHSVEPATTKKEGVMQKHYHIFPENFEKQMQYLKDQGYSPIPFKQMIRYYEYGGDLPEKPVVITFDDGWKNQYTYAYPILKKFGYPATFFIITKSRGGVYMTWEEIRELDRAGMDIGSHTETHANLSKETEQVITKEVGESKKTLEKELGHPIQSLAYPYYGNNTLAQDLIRKSGYRAARAGWTGKKNSKEALMRLASQEAVNNTNPFSSKAAH